MLPIDSSTFEHVQIEDIVIGKHRRPVDQDRVASLAASISEVGLQSPISLTASYHLIAGRHRVEAFRQLGKKTIPAVLHELNHLQAELAEIDENLERNQLTALEESKALARRKELYEALHPETKPVNKRGGPGRGHKENQRQNDVGFPEGKSSESAAPSFTEDTAKKTGRSKSNIERKVRIGEKLTDAAAEAIQGTTVADNQAELLKLAGLTPEAQVQVAQDVKDGVVKTVTEAVEKCLDQVGREVPERLRPIFEHVSEYRGMVAKLKAYCNRCEELAGDQFLGAWLQGFLQLKKDLLNARHALKFATPYAVCPYCKGTGGTCAPCKGTGFVNETVYRNAPGEMK